MFIDIPVINPSGTISFLLSKNLYPVLKIFPVIKDLLSGIEYECLVAINIYSTLTYKAFGIASGNKHSAGIKDLLSGIEYECLVAINIYSTLTYKAFGIASGNKHSAGIKDLINRYHQLIFCFLNHSGSINSQKLPTYTNQGKKRQSCSYQLHDCLLSKFRIYGIDYPIFIL